MKGVTLNNAINSIAMLQDMGGMKLKDRVLICHARSHHLAAARVPGHEVGLNQTGDYFKVGLDKTPIYHDRDTLRGFAQVHVSLFIPGKVIFHTNGVKHLIRTDDFSQFLSLTWTVESGGHEDQDVFTGNPSRGEGLNKGWKQGPVGHRPRNIADQDTGASPPR